MADDDLLTISRLAVGYAKSIRGELKPPRTWENALAGYLTDEDGVRWAVMVIPSDGDRAIQRGVVLDAEHFLDTGITPARSFALGTVALVCGGRSGQRQDFVSRALDAWERTHGISGIIHGACEDRGDNAPATEADALARDGVQTGWSADMCADRWAKARGVASRPVPACWYPVKDGPLDRSAGPRRNERMRDMLVEARGRGQRAVVLAFPGGTGTAGMVALALGAGLPTWQATDRGWIRVTG